jgi:HEAT repeat protein
VTSSLRPKLGTTDTDLDIALVLFAIDVSSTEWREKGILLAAMYGEGSTWLRFGAAVQLIQIGEKDAWELLLTALDNKKAEGLSAAYSLGQLGARKLIEFGICDHQNLVDDFDPLHLVKQRLQLELNNESNRLAKNPIESNTHKS